MTFRTRRPSPHSSQPIKFQATQQTIDRATFYAKEAGFSSFISYLQNHVKLIADRVPQSAVPLRERQDHWNFSNPVDVQVQEDVHYACEDLLKVKPDGFTMADMWNIMSGDMQAASDENPRALVILYGRCLKNLGYKKVRARLPSRIGEPVKYGFVYRKGDGG